MSLIFSKWCLPIEDDEEDIRDELLLLLLNNLLIRAELAVSWLNFAVYFEKVGDGEGEGESDGILLPLDWSGRRSCWRELFDRLWLLFLIGFGDFSIGLNWQASS